jgi:O-antigen/teichoic acid export membrane protein
VPLIPHAFAGVLLATADRFSVASILGPASLGIYGTAGQLGMILIVLGDAANKALAPWVYAQMGLRTTRAHLRVVGVAWALLPVWLLVAVVAWLSLELVGGIVVGPRYLPSIDLSIWFLLGGALSASYLNIANLFFFTSRTEWLSAATVASGLVAVVLAPALARRYGAIGAAASYLCVQCVNLVLFWALSTRVQPMPWRAPLLALRLLRAARRQAPPASAAA